MSLVRHGNPTNGRLSPRTRNSNDWLLSAAIVDDDDGDIVVSVSKVLPLCATLILAEYSMNSQVFA